MSDRLIHDVPEETILVMKLFGHIRLADDGIYELTEVGNKWLKEWCKARLAEHEKRDG